jgi:hypothetical protein
MCKTQGEEKQSQNRTNTLRDWMELFYSQAVLPEQNDIICYQQNSTTLRYTALCFKFHIWQHCLQAATNSVVRSGLAWGGVAIASGMFTWDLH